MSRLKGMRFTLAWARTFPPSDSPGWTIHFIERNSRYWVSATNEAQNSALRRRASAYRRRQNLYAKCVEGLQRVLAVQRLVHNWVRPHWGRAKHTTPAMAMGYIKRPISMLELLTHRGFLFLIH
jgi:hypothetical protein